MKKGLKKSKSTKIFSINIRKHRGLYRFLIVSMAIFSIFYCYLTYLVTPLMVETCNASIKVTATQCINYAIAQAMSQNLSYDDLINIVTDSSGKISMIQANSVKINTLSKLINKVTLSELSNISTSVLQIPLGAFSGISILAGLGPKVNIEIFPYGDATCSFLSEFSSAGINQTIHKIYLSIDTSIRVVLPMKTITVKNAGQAVLCESLIVGEIPEVYLQSGRLNEMLNLIPN